MNFLDLGASRFAGIYAFSKTHFKMMGCDDAKFRGGLGSELGFGSGRLPGPGNGQKAVLVPVAVEPAGLNQHQTKKKNRASTRDRTEDLVVNSHSLYQRSSGGVGHGPGRARRVGGASPRGRRRHQAEDRGAAGATEWRNGSALDSRPKGWGFESLFGHPPTRG